MTTLCAHYHISRKTGYKWLERYAAGGPAALCEQPRRPRTSPTATPPAVVAALCALRTRHPTWGGKKLVTVLARRFPQLPRLAPSTAAALLKRLGLITHHRRRRPLRHPGQPATGMTMPNAVWTTDFKGQFPTGDGVLCYPLTVADGARTLKRETLRHRPRRTVRSNGSSIAFSGSSTRSGRTQRSTSAPRPPATPRQAGRTPPPFPRSSIPRSAKCAA